MSWQLMHSSRARGYSIYEFFWSFVSCFQDFNARCLWAIWERLRHTLLVIFQDFGACCLWLELDWRTETVSWFSHCEGSQVRRLHVEIKKMTLKHSELCWSIPNLLIRTYSFTRVFTPLFQRSALLVPNRVTWWPSNGKKCRGHATSPNKHWAHTGCTSAWFCRGTYPGLCTLLQCLDKIPSSTSLLHDTAPCEHFSRSCPQ